MYPPAFLLLLLLIVIIYVGYIYNMKKEKNNYFKTKTLKKIAYFIW